MSKYQKHKYNAQKTELDGIKLPWKRYGRGKNGGKMHLRLSTLIFRTYRINGLPSRLATNMLGCKTIKVPQFSVCGKNMENPKST